MKEKEFYSQPQVDVFTLQSEDAILTVSGGGGINSIPEDGFGNLDDFILP